MRFLSTRGAAPPVDLATALTRSLAPDGGLYLPERIDPLPPGRLAELRGAPLPEIAVAALGPFFAEIPEPELAAIAAGALDFPIPLVEVRPFLVLELFHGPTLAFKDVGARFLARLLAWVRRGAGRPLTVLVATSGDTGGAVAAAFHGVAGTRVVALYPAGQISPLQERQMTTLGGNVRALAVDGAFDDCQRLVKAAFADRALAAELELTSANSINLGRLLPQAVYYLHAAGLLPAGAPPPLFSVPSGNFGDLTAGVIARRLGIPEAAFLAATNVNDVVPRFLAGGALVPRPSRRTMSSAMDVGDPSNVSRIAALYGCRPFPPADPAALDRLRGALGGHLTAVSFDDRATRDAIRRVRRATGTVLDPHTAVGWLALERALADAGSTAARGRTPVVLATAHPAKFGEVIEPVIGEPVPLPPRLAERLDLPTHTEPLAADPAAFADYLRALPHGLQ
jgi:threonine synthase